MDLQRASLKQSALRGLVGIASVFFSFLSWNCFDKPLDPVMPTWNVDLTFPLAHRTYSLNDIVRKDTSMLRVGEGGRIIYAASVAAAPTLIGDRVSISLPDTTTQVNFGVFSIQSPPITKSLDIPWMPHGAAIPIPDTTIVVPGASVMIPTFQSVTFAEGILTLSLRNNLPVPMEVTQPVHLFDDQQRLVATFVFSPATIPPNSERSAFDDLENRTLSNQLLLSGLILHTPGSQTPVQTPDGDFIVATITPSDLKARQAVFAEIPPQSLANNDSARIILDDSTLVLDALLHSGQLGFSFQSRVNLPILFKFRMDELLRNSGGAFVAYEDSIFLPAHGAGSFDLSLAGYRIRSTDGDLLRSLRIVSSIVIPEGSGQPVTVNDTDKVELSLSSTAPFHIDTAVAVIKPTWLDINTPVVVDFGELPNRFSGQLNIPSASLNLGTGVTFGFPTDLYVSIAARRPVTGQWVYLHVPNSQKRIQPGVSTVNFSPSEVGQFFSQFAGSLPETLFVMGQVLVNPPEVYTPSVAGVGGIGRHSSFRGRVDIEVPLMLGISDGHYRDTLVVGDTTGDGNSDFNKNRLREVNHGRLFVEVENALPLRVGFDLGLLDRAGYQLLRLPHDGSSINVAPATVDGSGNVTIPAQSRVMFELSSDHVRQFDPAELISYAVSLATTPGSPAVRFRTTDYVRIRVWSTLSYRVNG